MSLGRAEPTRALFLRRRTLCECDCTVQHLHPQRQFPVIAYTALHCCDLDQPSILALSAPAIPTPYSYIQPSLSCAARPGRISNVLSCHTPQTLDTTFFHHRQSSGSKVSHWVRR